MEIFGRQAVAIDRNGVALGQHRQAADVVAMLVREENRLHVGHGPADGGEPQLDLFGAEPGIDEDAGVLGLEVGAVAAAATAEDGETQHEYVSGYSTPKSKLLHYIAPATKIAANLVGTKANP